MFSEVANMSDKSVTRGLKTAYRPWRRVVFVRLFSGLCLLSAVSMGVAVPSQSRGDDLVLGMSAAFDGPSRGLGIELYRGAMAYFEYINQDGGIHGQKIVLKAYDDRYEPGP